MLNTEKKEKKAPVKVSFDPKEDLKNFTKKAKDVIKVEEKLR